MTQRSYTKADRERQVSCDITSVDSSKNNTNELIYKAETDFKTSSWLSKGKGQGRHELELYTPLYIKQITHEDLLCTTVYSTESSIFCNSLYEKES